MKTKVMIWVLAVVVGLPLWASCMNDSEADFGSALQENQANVKKSAEKKSKGLFNLVWMARKTYVDNAEFSFNDDSYYAYINYLPAKYLLSWVIPDIQQEDLMYGNNFSLPMDLRMNGYSQAGNAYYLSGVWAPRLLLTIKGEEHEFIPFFHTEEMAGNYTTLMYDIQKDTWSGSLPIDSFSLKNLKTNYAYRHRFSPMLDLSFQTTGRKQK